MVTILLGVVAFVAVVAMVWILVVKSHSEADIRLANDAEKNQLVVDFQSKIRELELQLDSQREQAKLQHESIVKEMQIQLQSSRREADILINNERERYANFEKSQAELRKTEKENYDKMYADQEQQFEKRMATMKAEFEKLANDILDKKSEGMKQVNQESLDKLLLPLREKLDTFKHEVEQSKKSGIETSSKMEQIIKGLMEQTQKLGCDANNLAEALKSKPKMQGNWGEAVLKDILLDSGLREGEEFFVQHTVNDEEGNRLIPDVVVKFAGKGSVIIDSKVSLKAYTDYMCCENESHRDTHLKAHLDSIRQHVKELSTKSYASYVKDSVGMVLMFVPNEGAYILAMQHDQKLFSDAYRSKVLIINPTNLMLSLSIIYSVWQSRRQERNVEKIIQSATGLYEKFAVFSKTFVELKGKIDSLNNTFNEAEKQLTTGRGNVVKQLSDLKQLGVMPKKEISLESAEE